MTTQHGGGARNSVHSFWWHHLMLWACLALITLNISTHCNYQGLAQMFQVNLTLHTFKECRIYTDDNTNSFIQLRNAKIPASGVRLLSSEVHHNTKAWMCLFVNYGE